PTPSPWRQPHRPLLRSLNANQVPNAEVGEHRQHVVYVELGKSLAGGTVLHSSTPPWAEGTWVSDVAGDAVDAAPRPSSHRPWWLPSTHHRPSARAMSVAREARALVVRTG